MTHKPPLYYATIPFALGIIAQREFSLIAPLILLLFIVLNRDKIIPVIAFSVVGALMGFLCQHQNLIPYGQSIEIVSRTETIPTTKGKWQRAVGNVLSYKDSTGVWHSVDQDLQLYIDTSAPIALGNTVLFKTKHYPIDSTYQSYYNNKGIIGRAYGHNVEILKSDTTLLERIKVASSRLSSKITQINTSERNIALMQALTLGDRSGIERQHRQEYNRTGTAHMLAVSGLHVGIIFMVLSFLLGWIKLLRNGLVIYCVVLILILWGYAAITGFSPSVMRAVVMFTLYQIGIMISRSSDNLNTLLGAGLILLLCDPNYLYDIGFQLSFTAMFGIVLLYKPIYSLWPNRVWSLVSITLSAQIAVIPLSCYYFGTIPLAGIFMNLALWMVVPAVIVLTFIYLATSIETIGAASAWIADLQNKFVAWSATHDWIALENIDMPLWLCLTIYAAMIAVIRISQTRITESPNH